MTVARLKLIAGVMVIACAVAVKLVMSDSTVSPLASALRPFIQGDGFLPYAVLIPPLTPFNLPGALKADDMYSECGDHERRACN